MVPKDGFVKTLRADMRANRRNPKGKIIVVLYRFANACTRTRPLFKPVAFIYVAIYKLLTEYILGSEIHWRTTAGPGLAVFHGYGLVVHSDAKLGSNVTLRQGVTIGAKSGKIVKVPVLGDNVDVGSAAIILGGINVGDGAVIGAGAVVTKDVPPYSVVVGNPARIIKSREGAPFHESYGDSSDRSLHSGQGSA
jgi:putative colanic acid biosynthesis acetyltransferase WcaB